MLNVGDLVRVKADTTPYEMARCGYTGEPYSYMFGVPLKVTKITPTDIGDVSIRNESSRKGDTAHSGYLEPWNDAEHWNGTAWVPNDPTPAPVITADAPPPPPAFVGDDRITLAREAIESVSLADAFVIVTTHNKNEFRVAYGTLAAARSAYEHFAQELRRS